MNNLPRCAGWLLVLTALAPWVLMPAAGKADGMVVPPAKYQGSLEETAQEAIIIFDAPQKGEASEDLILKIRVEGEVSKFAWIVPFPAQPKVKKADAKLFKELYDYVRFRQKPKNPSKKMAGGMGGGFGGEEQPVEVLSREIVGSYDVATVREKTRGTLNKWLADEGYRGIDGGDEVIEFYRKKDYVFCCIKVSEADLKAKTPVDLHPLRFTFTTGGRDGIYFPMKLSGLLNEPFDVNLYVFYKWWLNDSLNEYGYDHRGFRRYYRDWDGPYCKPDAGKAWDEPRTDPFLQDAAKLIPNVARLMHELYPRKRFYLTNIQANQLKPAEVRKWKDDLWLFPYYLDKKRVPFDARPNGVAADWYVEEK